jgi:hypothetical protein
MAITLQLFWVRVFLFLIKNLFNYSHILIPHVSGQISASLAAMQRTIDDYDSMAKREMIKVKQEKARL